MLTEVTDLLFNQYINIALTLFGILILSSGPAYRLGAGANVFSLLRVVLGDIEIVEFDVVGLSVFHISLCDVSMGSLGLHKERV